MVTIAGRRARRTGALLMGGMGGWMLATMGGWTPETGHLWAFSFLTYVPRSVRFVMVGMLVGCVVAAALDGSGRQEQGKSRNRFFESLAALPLWVWLALAALIFWFGREHTWHGDALLKLQLLATESLQSDPYVWKEPLDSLLVYAIAGPKGVLGFLGVAPEIGIALLSVAAGLLYVWAVSMLVRRMPDSDADSDEENRANWQVAWAVGLFALGSSQLWFGHVENYSWSTATMLATAAMAVGYLQGKTPLWAVGLMGGLSVSFHPQAAFALPAFFFLLWRGHWPRQVAALAASLLIVPMLTAGILWGLGAPLPNFAQGYAGDRQLFWTLSQALHPVRLLDAVDNLWLVAPLFPLWLAAGFWGWAQPEVRRNALFGYTAALAIGLLFYHFAFQNDLARVRDWDLFAIVGPGVTLWGLVACRLFWLAGAPPLRRGVEGVLITGLAFALLFTTAWVGVNQSYTLLRPNPDQRELYARFRTLDLTELVESAEIVPDAPICQEATGCERVAVTVFEMPQDGDARPAIFAHAPAEISLTVSVPQERSFLWLSPALDPAAWEWGGDGVTFQVSIVAGGQEEMLWSRHLAPQIASDRDWHEVKIGLDEYQGQTVALKLATLPGSMNNDSADRAGWGLPWLMRGTADARFEREIE